MDHEYCFPSYLLIRWYLDAYLHDITLSGMVGWQQGH